MHYYRALQLEFIKAEGSTNAIDNIIFFKCLQIQIVFYMFGFSASKFGAVGFHECMTAELAALGKDGIKTSCLCPVFVNTGFVQKPSTR